MTFDHTIILVMYFGIACALLWRKLYLQRSLLEELKSDATKRGGTLAALLFLIGPGIVIAPLATYTYIQALGLSPFQFSAWLRTLEFSGMMFVAFTPSTWGPLFIWASVPLPAFLVGACWVFGSLILLKPSREFELLVYAHILYLSLIVLGDIVVRVLCFLGKMHLS